MLLYFLCHVLWGFILVDQVIDGKKLGCGDDRNFEPRRVGVYLHR